MYLIENIDRNYKLQFYKSISAKISNIAFIKTYNPNHISLKKSMAA